MTATNRMRLSSVLEATLGTTPASPRMRTGRVTGESLSYAPSFTTSAELRSDRMNADPVKTGETTEGGLNAELSYPVDETFLSDLLRSLMWNDWTKAPQRDNDGTADSNITGVSASTDTYTVLTGAPFVEGQLVRATGFANSGNNSIFRAQSGSNATSVIAPSSPGLTDESAPAAAARLKVVGFQGASGDVTAAAGGLASSALDFTTLGIVAGQWIKIGGSASGDKFATAALNDWARVAAVAAHALTLDNLPAGWTTDSGTGKTIKVWFGDQIKNGTTRRSLSIERSFLGQGTPTHILSRGMVVNTLDLNVQSERQVELAFALMGLTSAQGTSEAGASYDAATTSAVMAGSVNVGRIAEGGSLVASPNWAKSLRIQANNNLRRLTAVDAVGAVDVQPGDFGVTGTLETYFGDNALLAKLLAGTVGSLGSRLQKNGQAIVVQAPRVTFTGGAPNAGQKNSDVMLALSFEASYDPLTAAHLIFDRLEYYE